MFWENNTLPYTTEGPYTSYFAANSGVDVESFSIHDNPDDWEYSDRAEFVEEFKIPLIVKKHLIMYNSYGNPYKTASFVQQVEPTIYSQYMTKNQDSNEISFDIYRKTPYQKYLEYVCPMGNGFVVYDYNITSNNYYHYVAVATVATPQDEEHPYKFMRYEQKNLETGKPQYYHTKFDSWTICDIIEQDDNYYFKDGRIWNLGLNLENPSVSQNLSVASWDTQGRYGKTSIGRKNYDSSRFTSLLGKIKEYTAHEFSGAGNYDSSHPVKKYQYTEMLEYYVGNENELNVVDCSNGNWSVDYEYGIETAKLEAWKEFISNGELKLLRDIKGHAWIIQIADSPEYTINENTNLKQTQISFSWKEVANVKESSIVSFESLNAQK